MAKEPSFNYSYTPTVDHREANLYREEYYSSTDTKIYMDDEEQTEIGFIQYEIQEQLKPVYGYNSRTFDDVVIGNRIVTGTFTVPIKNKAPQEFFKDTETSSNNELSAGINEYNTEEENNLYNTEWFGSTVRNIENYENQNIDAEVLVKLTALGYDVDANATTQQYQKALKQFQKDNNISATFLNSITLNTLNAKFNQLNAKEIELAGITGYNDLGLTRGAKTLYGNALILETIKKEDEDIYYIMDDTGSKYYIKGITING